MSNGNQHSCYRKRRRIVAWCELFIMLLLPIVCVYSQDEEILEKNARPVVVDIPRLGRVQGKRLSGTDFFGGIPYAAPPVGNLRWAPPEPAAPWSPAKLDASHFGPDCWQIYDPLINPTADIDQMSEDCLYLNVFTPAGHSARSDKLPVMVWLHGGAFRQGGARRAEYDGRRLAERGTIVVTLNYRLGALGFLVSSSDGVLGNFGLMDQRAALFWVKDNIRYFGGDPDNVTLFGESAGAVMTLLHLMMDGAGKLFHKAIIQSNPLGFQFRSIVVADFIGEALKHSVDCRDLACLRSERVEEIMRAQSSLMGVPRSVGDFFTWAPTLSDSLKLVVGIPKGGFGNGSPLTRGHDMFRDLDSWKWQMNRDTAWAAVNVSQPLKNLDLIPDDIPIIIGANKHEGEMFVHGAFPITMSKAVYWMFVGALFRDSASRVLRHYRGYVDQIEREAQELARMQIEEEENRQYYVENREQLEKEYQMLLDMNVSSAEDIAERPGLEEFVATWSRGGGIVDDIGNYSRPFFTRLWPFPVNGTSLSDEEKFRLREERRILRAKEKALREAAKVVVDYRPVMSRIIDDYLFRCPAWHFAHKLSQMRLRKGHANNVYVYQFSHSTHIPGFKECWGKACHTAEIPYAFEAMDIIRANYSTLSPIAQKEAPRSPEYPYTEFLAAYKEALQAADRDDTEEPEDYGDHNYTQSTNFQRILDHFFGDYFKEDPDEDIANDMANRWYAFARNGDPNYSESKAEWRPWRYALEEQEVRNQRIDKDSYKSGKGFDLDHIFSLDNIGEEEWDNSTIVEGFSWSGAFEERVFRRRVLEELGMEVAAEDVFQTMLRRKAKSAEDQDYSFNSLLFGSVAGPKSRQGSREQQRRRRALRQLIQIAQDMKIMGTGLQGDNRRGQTVGSWEDDFFPQILELKWPPEDRLVERDCTCDMWDRIRYRY